MTINSSWLLNIANGYGLYWEMHDDERKDCSALAKRCDEVYGIEAVSDCEKYIYTGEICYFMHGILTFEHRIDISLVRCTIAYKNMSC
jgi:hypothetical protein